MKSLFYLPNLINLLQFIVSVYSAQIPLLTSPFLSFRGAPNPPKSDSIGRKIVDLPSSGEPWHSPKMLGDTAKLGNKCNQTLHAIYGDKIYQRMLDGLDTFKLEAQIVKYLTQNPDERRKSCYGCSPLEFSEGRYVSVLNFYECDDGFCQCLQKGLLTHVDDGEVPTGCKIKDSSYQDTCDYNLYTGIFLQVYEPAFQQLKKARSQKRHEYVVQKFYEGRGDFYLLNDTNYVNQRKVCKSENLELECAEDSFCRCRSWKPHFSFRENKKRSKCVAEQGTWCHPLASDINERKFATKKSLCDDDNKCQFIFGDYGRLAACGGPGAWCESKKFYAKIKGSFIDYDGTSHLGCMRWSSFILIAIIISKSY